MFPVRKVASRALLETESRFDDVDVNLRRKSDRPIAFHDGRTHQTYTRGVAGICASLAFNDVCQVVMSVGLLAMFDLSDVSKTWRTARPCKHPLFHPRCTLLSIHASNIITLLVLRNTSEAL